MFASLLAALVAPAFAQAPIHVGTLEVTYCWSSTTFDERCPRTHVELWADTADADEGDAEVTVVILDNGQTFEDSAWGTFAFFQKVTRSGKVKDKLRIKFTGDNGVRYVGTLASHGCYDGKMKTLPSNVSAIANEGVFRACEL